jgi:hypothetical protein
LITILTLFVKNTRAKTTMCCCCCCKRLRVQSVRRKCPWDRKVKRKEVNYRLQ